MSVLVRGLGEKAESLNLKDNHIQTIEDLKYFLIKKFQLKLDEELSFSSNGKNIKSKQKITENFAIYDVKILQRGGKGGFGSLLKGQPPVKKRTNNTDSCRDLSGRRMRHVNQEKMIKEWQQKKLEEEKLLKMYNNPNEEGNVKDYIDSDKRKEVMRLNKKYLVDSVETSDSVSQSIRFLLKKQKRDGAKNIQETVEIKKLDYLRNNEDNKNNNIYCNKTEILKLDEKTFEANVDEKELEDKLFSLD
jgi:hypothetical protein